MRVAVIADIHGNCVALDAVLADLEPVDALVCLGDVVEGGPQPAEALARVRELGCPVVMGNCDEWFLDFQTDGLPDWRAVRGRWTLERLGAGGVDFIRSFQPTVVLDVGERSLLCFHGSPRSCEELLLPTTPDEEFEEKLGGADADVLTGGHIHLQWLRRVRGSSFFNPGSVGMANDLMRAAREQGFDDHAEYGVLTATDGRLAVDLRRVPYDVERLVHEIYASGLPYAEDAAEKWSARRG